MYLVCNCQQRLFMDLTIKDLAELLNVSIPMIEHWIDTSMVPYYKMQDRYLFNRIEIEDWVMHCKNVNVESDFSKPALDLATKFSLYRSIFHGGVYVDITGNKSEIISKTVAKIANKLGFDKNVLEDLLFDREKLMPTSLNNGIAVPHAREFLMPGTTDVITIVFPKTPVEYGALDGKAVHTLFFLFACEDKRHLHLLAKIAHFCQNSANIEFLKIKPNQSELLSYIKTWESQIRPLTVSETYI